jgi:hypothetical protein
MDGTTLMDGSSTLQGTWNPIDCGKIPYVASEQPWTVELGVGKLSNRVAQHIRVYVASYSDQVDEPLVRYGLTGATPSYVVTIPAQTVTKPGSGSNITPYLVTGITGSVSSAVTVSGKLRRPIGITVDLTGLPTELSSEWAYQLLGFKDNDLTSAPFLESGLLTKDGLAPAGPDQITVPHTFGPEEPTAVTSITVYAVAGLIAPDRFVHGAPPRTPGSFASNNIVPGITASCVISIGTTGGVIDPTQHIQSLLDTSVGVLGTLFGVLPGGVDNVRIALLAVDTTKLQALAVTAAKLVNSSVTAVAIANLAVGTVAIQTAAISTALIQNAAITNALIGNLAVGTAQIQDLAVGTAQIASLAVTTAKIGDAQITTAKIGDAQITTAKIATLQVSQLTGWDGASISVGGGMDLTGTAGAVRIADSTVRATESGGGFASVGVYSSTGFGTLAGGFKTAGLTANLNVSSTIQLHIHGGIITGYSVIG